jgi:hypothetical protein
VLELETSFASRRVTRELEKIVAERRAPEAIRCGNRPEFTLRLGTMAPFPYYRLKCERRPPRSRKSTTIS